jgi:hypothetical protein
VVSSFRNVSKFDPKVALAAAAEPLAAEPVVRFVPPAAWVAAREDDMAFLRGFRIRR